MGFIQFVFAGVIWVLSEQIAFDNAVKCPCDKCRTRDRHNRMDLESDQEQAGKDINKRQ